MADPEASTDVTEPDSKASQTVDSPGRSWMVPIITVLLLATTFCLYYFVYVGARREYLVNRNFRALAGLGDQLQRTLSVHGTILEFYSNQEQGNTGDFSRAREDITNFLVIRPKDKDLQQEVESRKDYLHYLAPTLDLDEETAEPGASSKPRNRLQVQRRNGRWEVKLSAQQPPTRKDKPIYLGSLDVREVMKVRADSLPFDDILLVSDNGSVVYQNKNAGPQFTTLSSLLKAQVSGADTKPGAPESKEGGADRPWQAGAIHLTDVMLAGTRYKLFVQPILLDVYTDNAARSEPAREWVLCGLRASSALEWEALSISYTSIIVFTALFFAICMGGPMLKVIFINHRERFRLREVAFLSLFLVLLSGVFTLTALQSVHFSLSDDVEAQLGSLGETLSNHIHDDLKNMREQLQEWCRAPQLIADLQVAKDREVIRKTQDPGTGKPIGVTPPPTKYPYMNNAFWTDDDGVQVVKWSTGRFVTPLIDLSKVPVFTAPRQTYLDGAGPPFYFNSLLPPNKFQYLAALTMDTLECHPGLQHADIRSDILGGSASVTGQPFSLIDPILPLGYGFALVDDTGLVLFHSDKTKNGRENFREESDWSKELYAGTFGHSSQHSLRINYLGKDCRALMVPVPGVTQAPWSLIVYTDLTPERTVALQTMTMAATLLLSILAIPALLVAIWCLVRRPLFAPEWLWPNQHRMASYLYQICLYTLLIAAFLFLGFRGPIEQIVVACAAVPYSAMLLTLWCFRRYPSAADRARGRNAGYSAVAPVALSVLSAAVFLSLLIFHWSHLKALVILPVIVAIGAVPLLEGPRRYVATMVRYRRRLDASGQKSSLPSRALNYTHCYALGVLLLLLLTGVLMPMALFRGCMAVERRLDVKQAQVHLASDVAERWGTIQRDCEGDEAGSAACEKLMARDSHLWREIVLRPASFGDREPSIVPHEVPCGQPHKNACGVELYEHWFQGLLYLLHHQYNASAAETLGVIQDRVAFKRGDSIPDWSWENGPSTLKLRWHGVHPPGSKSAALGKAGVEQENDLLIESRLPATLDGAWSGFGIATVVMLVMGGFLWMLVRKVFLLDVAPLKMTGLWDLAESLRLGQNVLVLVPPFSDFAIEAPARTVDLTALANEPGWAGNMDLRALPLGGLLEIRHFEYNSDLATADQKTVLLNRLLQMKTTQIAAIGSVPPSTEDYRRTFPQLTIIDLREEPFLWLKQYEGPARDLIWKECMPMAALWPLGAQLAEDIRTESVQSSDAIASEVLERADPYYRMIWKEFTSEQKFVLSQLAEDGMVNPMNGRAIRQLIRRGFILRDPQFRIMNESFRRFLKSATTDDLKQNWHRESRRSGWGKLQGAFFTTMIVVGVFLLTTQNALWQSSAAYVTTAFGALGTLAKLFNTYRGSAGGEKAN